MYWTPSFGTPETQDGSIYPQSQTRFKDISDGLSHTLLIAETREQNASVWIDGTTASITALRFDDNNSPSYAGVENPLNYTPYYVYGGSSSIDMLYGPSRMHAGIVCHLFADGSAQPIAETTSPGIYAAAGHPRRSRGRRRRHHGLTAEPKTAGECRNIAESSEPRRAAICC